ncbi:MAG: UDP-N,N'-diacetylbacillosamine 2-epimerase (hydrolyzing) [Candidatus Omnitrophica bacterium ADurb.Bin277]|nr:MAG: UDP-N,N'-diacetylbacillosamine 2-epimerase (hydrolyzing) [Candidatus Omnitrophica bacterium ADurb.Bin277]
MKRKIFFLTGTRAEYDLLYPVLEAVNRTRGLRGEVIVSGAHLSPFHGMNINEIVKDRVPVAGRIESLMASETPEGRAISFSNLFSGLTRMLSERRPDILVVAGDREEALAGALAGNFLGIHVAHIYGGDRCLASDIDEVFRPAISKLAHLHFTAAEKHKTRLIKMGEAPETIWACGATGLDRLRKTPDLSDDVLNKKFGIDVKAPFFILIHHPTPTLNPARSGEEIEEVLKGVLPLGYPVFCSYPNFDPGNIAIRSVIDATKTKYANLIAYHNLSRDVFVALYKRCAAILGNSSSIVIEAGFLKKPGILIGPRQNLREVGSNVVRVAATATAVRKTALSALRDKSFLAKVKKCESLYGDGHSAERIAAILKRVKLDAGLLRKTMIY